MNAHAARSWITAAATLPEACARYFAYTGATPEPWQFAAFVMAAGEPESAHKWSRRLGKTDNLGHHLGVFFTLFGLKGTHFAAGEDQLVQPREYYVLNPFVTSVTQDWVAVLGRPLIRLKPLTNKNARSTTADFNIFDEEASLDAHQQPAVDIAKIITRNSPFARNVHISTPLVGSQFETTYKRLEASGHVTSHPYTDVRGTWLNVGEILADQAVMPDWLWRQEYLAEFTVPGGVVFPNVVIGPYTLPSKLEAMLRSVGVDFNGTPGDVAIEVAMPGGRYAGKDVFVLGEEVFPHPETGLDLSWLREYPGERRVEGGGYNEGFALDACRYGAIPQENTQQARSSRLTTALSLRIHVDPAITPQLYEDIRSARWDPRGIIAYLKDDVHGMHYADALMLALPGLQQQEIWGPGRARVDHQSPAARERQRERAIRHGR